MKKIIMIGKNSYIGNRIAERLLRQGDAVDRISVRGDDWREKSFQGYDCMVYMAGLVHCPEITDLEEYRRINRDLTLAVAKKAKEEGVGQFLFFSTMAVYGVPKSLKGAVITAETRENPGGPYSISKLEAERELLKLKDDRFRVAILRPPNVYGPGCPGNYITGFASMVRRLPAIPEAFTDVRQSMIFVDNLAELAAILVERNGEGIFCPQDERAVSAVELMEALSSGMGHQKKRSVFLGALVKALSFTPIVKKAYGGVAYEPELSEYDMEYRICPVSVSLSQSITKKNT